MNSVYTHTHSQHMYAYTHTHLIFFPTPPCVYVYMHTGGENLQIESGEVSSIVILKVSSIVILTLHLLMNRFFGLNQVYQELARYNFPIIGEEEKYIVLFVSTQNNFPKINTKFQLKIPVVIYNSDYRAGLAW